MINKFTANCICCDNPVISGQGYVRIKTVEGASTKWITRHKNCKWRKLKPKELKRKNRYKNSPTTGEKGEV